MDSYYYFKEFISILLFERKHLNTKLPSDQITLILVEEILKIKHQITKWPRYMLYLLEIQTENTKTPSDLQVHVQKLQICHKAPSYQNTGQVIFF